MGTMITALHAVRKVLWSIAMVVLGLSISGVSTRRWKISTMEIVDGIVLDVLYER